MAITDWLTRSGVGVKIPATRKLITIRYRSNERSFFIFKRLILLTTMSINGNWNKAAKPNRYIKTNDKYSLVLISDFI